MEENKVERFQAAIAARKEELAREGMKEQKTFNPSPFLEVHWTTLQLNKDTVVRLRGGPILPDRKPTDCKAIFQSMILADNGKKFRCIGPNPKIERDWIVYKVMNQVLKSDWNPDLEGIDGRKGGKVYRYAKSFPGLFTRVFKNNSENAYETGWRFTQSDIWNVIDRQQMEWHRENKMCRLLSKKASTPSPEGQVWYDVGVPHTVYNQIVEDVLAMDGNTDWEKYDIVIRKLNDRPWYKVMHGLDDIKHVLPEAKPFIVSGDLTEEELSWKMHDLDAIYPITSYGRIQEKLGLFIQEVDKSFNTKFYDELLSLADKEAKESPYNKKVEMVQPDYVKPVETTSKPVETNASPVDDEPVPEWVQPSQPEVQTQATVQTRSTIPVVPATSTMTDEIWSKLADGSYNGKVYKGVPLMTPEEKALVLAVNEDGSFKWRPGLGDLYQGAESGFLAPGCLHIDPITGTSYPADTVTPIPAL